jgi:hypothetical protein
VGKELGNLTLWHSPHIGIPWVIDEIVIPQDETITLHDTQHFGRDLLFQAQIKN